MKFTLSVVWISEPKIPIEDIHKIIFTAWSNIDGKWRLDKIPQVPKVKSGDITAHCDLAQCLPNGALGYVSYSIRVKGGNPMADSIEIEFHSNLQLYQEIISKVIPLLINLTHPFQILLKHEFPVGLSFDSNNEIRVPSRSSKTVISSVFLLNENLLREVFSIDLAKAYKRLKSLVENVEIIGDAIFVIGSSQILDSKGYRDLIVNLESELVKRRIFSFFLK